MCFWPLILLAIFGGGSGCGNQWGCNQCGCGNQWGCNCSNRCGCNSNRWC